MKRTLVVMLLLAVCASMALSVTTADAGIPRIGKRIVARCQTSWKPVQFQGNVLKVWGQIRCTKPMTSIKGYASLLRMKLVDGGLGEPSPQASAHRDFFLVQSNYYQFEVSHVCAHSNVSYKWWFTIRATWKYKGLAPQTKQGFSSTLITDCV